MKVVVPDQAKVYVDGVQITGQGKVRMLTTPEINRKQDYHYTIKVEAAIAGETRVSSKQVIVRAGELTNVDFSGLNESKATSALSLQAPKASKVMIDGVELTTNGGVMNVNTAEMAAGKAITYTIQAETPRDGRTEVETRKVTFKAGEPIVVNFAVKAADSVVTLK